MFRTSCRADFEQRMTLVLAQPLLQVEVVVLLAPQQSRERLTMHPALIFGQRTGRNPLVEFISVSDAAREGLLETAERVFCPGSRQTQLDSLTPAARHVEDIVGRGLGPRLDGIDRLMPSGDDVGVERILDAGRCVGLAPQTLCVALILGEEQLRCAITMEPILAQLGMSGLNGARPPFGQ